MSLLGDNNGDSGKHKGVTNEMANSSAIKIRLIAEIMPTDICIIICTPCNS